MYNHDNRINNKTNLDNIYMKLFQIGCPLRKYVSFIRLKSRNYEKTLKNIGTISFQNICGTIWSRIKYRTRYCFFTDI